jgi:hypothetical protein
LDLAIAAQRRLSKESHKNLNWNYDSEFSEEAVRAVVVQFGFSHADQIRPPRFLWSLRPETLCHSICCFKLETRINHEPWQDRGKAGANGNRTLPECGRWPFDFAVHTSCCRLGTAHTRTAGHFCHCSAHGGTGGQKPGATDP